jgi:hypothetical protein
MDLSMHPLPGLAGESRPLIRVIRHYAERCALDLDDAPAVRRFMDCDSSRCNQPALQGDACRELRALLTLHFRLETSSSEDLGISGLRRLWHLQGEIVARFNEGRAIRPALG